MTLLPLFDGDRERDFLTRGPASGPGETGPVAPNASKVRPVISGLHLPDAHRLQPFLGAPIYELEAAARFGGTVIALIDRERHIDKSLSTALGVIDDDRARCGHRDILVRALRTRWHVCCLPQRLARLLFGGLTLVECQTTVYQYILHSFRVLLRFLGRCMIGDRCWVKHGNVG